MVVAACGAKATPSTPVPKPVVVAPDNSACRTAYADYEVEWRAARTDELQEAMADYEDLIEETIRTELLTTPKRDEVAKMREIYAVMEAFVWTAPWPRALKAADEAIDRCGEGALKP